MSKKSLCFVLAATALFNVARADGFSINTSDRHVADALEKERALLESQGFFQDLPAVHEHLEMYGDGESLRTLYGWALEDGFRFSSYGDFLEKHTMLRPFPSREGGLNHFVFEVIPLYAKVIGKSEARIQEWSRLAVLAASRQRITRIAFRFSPGWLAGHSTLSWDLELGSVLDGLARGVREVEAAGGKIELQLYQIATREMSGSGNSEFVKNVAFFLKNKKYFAAFDIAGSELLAPLSNFSQELKPLIAAKAKDHDIHFTFHAGEEIKNASKSMTDAINAGADRIGHGIKGVGDPALNALMQEKHVTTEVCPTSNFLIAVVPSISAHPLPRLIAANYHPSISTDDPLVFSVVAKKSDGTYAIRPVGLWDEYANIHLPVKQGGMGLSVTQLKQLKANGQAQFASFQPTGPGRQTLNQILSERKAHDPL